METTIEEKMKIIHSPKRPNIDDITSSVFDNFIELHGDRLYGEDHAMCGGLAYLNGTPVTVIGQRKGKTTEENIKANFAMPHPEGYRKALRLAHQAEKFHRPVICFVDTPGAFCGIGAEERGQGEAIARNLYEFMGLRTPVISVVTGEGGSGGALAIAVANEVYMLENSMYSVISPRGCASILWKDASRELEAAEALHCTALDLYQFGMIEGIIREHSMLKSIRTVLVDAVRRLSAMSGEELRNQRYEKFRKIGVFNENI
ncbi:MAG: acetyl-CoA carboxylase carboxyl transferase subunit alpha [Butyricicoccaceae bacterium]